MNNYHDKMIEEHLIKQLDHHLDGLKEKIIGDFSKSSFESEIEALKNDSLYPKFAMATGEYVLIRFMGRMSISIGRRIGEIYDKIPRLIAQKVFDIPTDRIAPKMGGKLELDTCLPFDIISDHGRNHIAEVVKKYIKTSPAKNGIGIEIRYNFNPNDSSRLRKDEAMANHLINDMLTPVYLIFSSISPRADAISRLERAGWTFIIGENARRFSQDLYGINISTILEKESVNTTITHRVNEIMGILYSSYAFRQIADKYIR